MANSNEAMREALLCVLDIAKRDMLNYCRSRAKDQGESESIRAWSNTIVGIASNALALPRRQCDVGTAEEQYSRMFRKCYEWMCRDCKSSDKDFRKCALSWAQMPYEEGGAK